MISDANTLPPAEYWPETTEEERVRLGWLTDAQRHASLDATLAERTPGEPIWVFAYGSLLWKPAFIHCDFRRGLLRGFHRRFCLIVNRFRGSEEAPGLMLSLDRGGVCRSLVLRLDAKTELADMRALWQREMLSNAYTPRWSTVETDAGPVRAIAFVSNRQHRRYLRPGSDEEAAMMIARAWGPVGTCADYLHETHAHLLQLGINDRGLARLDKLVRARLAGQKEP